MANRYKDWAEKNSRKSPLRQVFNRGEIVRTEPTPQLVGPTGAPVGVASPLAAQPQSTVLAPAPPPASVQFAQASYAGRHGHPPVLIDPTPPTCQIVKVDTSMGDPYEQHMAAVPDIAKACGVKPPETNAMEMAGAPPGVSLEKWTPTARYYNGVSDLSAKDRAEGYVQRRDRELVDEANRRNG